MATASQKKPRTATHRPASRRRRFRHDDLIAVDLFSGPGFERSCTLPRTVA
jgi:hypothetical protein